MSSTQDQRAATATRSPAVKPLTSRPRAILATLLAVLLSALVPLVVVAGVALFAPSLLTPLLPDQATLQRYFARGFVFMLGLLIAIAPSATGAGYWLSLLRLRTSGALRTGLELLGLELLYFLGTLMLFGAEIYTYAVLAKLSAARDTFGHPFWVVDVVRGLPGLLLVVCALPLLYGIFGLAVALLFARWRVVRGLALPLRGWRDRLLPFAMAAALSLVSGLLLNVVFASFSSGEGAGAGAIRGTIELLALFIVPPVLLGIVASWSTFRTLRRTARAA